MQRGSKSVSGRENLHRAWRFCAGTRRRRRGATVVVRGKSRKWTGNKMYRKERQVKTIRACMLRSTLHKNGIQNGWRWWLWALTTRRTGFHAATVQRETERQDNKRNIPALISVRVHVVTSSGTDLKLHPICICFLLSHLTFATTVSWLNAQRHPRKTRRIFMEPSQSHWRTWMFVGAHTPNLTPWQFPGATEAVNQTIWTFHDARMQIKTKLNCLVSKTLIMAQYVSSPSTLILWSLLWRLLTNGKKTTKHQMINMSLDLCQSTNTTEGLKVL